MSASSDAGSVILQRDGAVARLTLNRPAQLNALDDTLVEALVAATATVAADTSIRAVILAGAGRHFMAGGDIKVFARSLADEGAARSARFAALITRVHAAVETLARMPQPIVARLHGAVAGFGLSLANACDLAFAGEDAYFASAYLSLGVTPDGGGTWWLPRIVGSRKAAEILLLGERFDASTALSIGLVNRVVPVEALDAAVEEAAQRIAAMPAFAVQNLKRLLRASSQHTLAEQLALEGASFAACTARGDFVEGIGAFLDKRPPRFGDA